MNKLLMELVTEVSYRYQASLLTAEIARAGLDIQQPETVAILCSAEQQVGALRAELAALRLTQTLYK